MYLQFGSRTVGIVARGATHVPVAILTSLPSLPAVEVGSPAEIRDGTVHVAGLAVSVLRTSVTGAPRISVQAAARLDCHALPDLAAVKHQLPQSALDQLAAADARCVLSLLGRGDGLTPVGDDVLAGWLAGSNACGRPVRRVAEAIRAHADRTTSLSASLLIHASAGECIPQFRQLLFALESGQRIPEAVARVASVGHTSGSGLLLGAHLAFSAENPKGTMG